MYICIKKCFFRDRLWEPGETLAPASNEVLPKHFVEKGKTKLEKKEVIEEPKTYADIQNEKPKSFLESVGVKKEKPKSKKSSDFLE